jgi:hypothetical protein
VYEVDYRRNKSFQGGVYAIDPPSLKLSPKNLLKKSAVQKRQNISLKTIFRRFKNV